MGVCCIVSDVAEQGSARSEGRSSVFICLLIFIVALAIRIPGIGWGLKNDLHNQSFHPDEPQIFDFVHQTNIFHPVTFRQYYNYGTLYYAILRGTDAIGQAVGAIHRPESLDLASVTSSPQKWDELNTYVSQDDLWGRFAGAILGAATAVLIFLILRRWTTLAGAICGAALIALSPAHVEHSRFQTVDIPSLFFVALTTLLCVRLLRLELTDKKKWWTEVVIASVLIGCAASTRYTDALMMFSLWVAIAVRRPSSWIPMAVVAPFVVFISFLATTPGFITDSDYFWQNFTYQMAHASEGHDLVFVGRPTGFVYHIYLLIVGISLLGAVIGIAGLLYAAIRKHQWAWVVLAFFLPYYISIGQLDTMFLRYGFPLYVGVACGFGYAISAIERKSNMSWLGIAVAALSLIGIENPQAGIRGTILFTQWMTSTDPRDAAGQYMKDVAAKNPNLDFGIIGSSPWFFTASVMKDSTFWFFQPPEVQASALSQTRDPHVVSFTSNPNPMYATYTSYEVEDGLRLKDDQDVTLEQLENIHTVNEQVRILNERYMVDQIFGDDGPGVHDLQYIRPKIWILKRRDLP